jgi:tricorn protease
VTPDVEVETLPKDWMAGRDAQLEKAIEVAMKQLKSYAPPVIRRPKYPVHK